MSLVFEALQELECERPFLDSPSQARTFELLWQVGVKPESKAESPSKEPNDEAARPLVEQEPLPHAVEFRLPRVDCNQASFPAPISNAPAPSTPAPATTSASSTEEFPLELPTGVRRVLAVLRAALPFAQRILPLLERNSSSAVPNILASHRAAPAPMPPADLAPIEDSLAALKTQHRELRERVIVQNASLNRCKNRLKLVREATDRNILEQKELIAGLKGAGSRINIAALVALSLVAASVVINVVLYLHLLKVVR